MGYIKVAYRNILRQLDYYSDLPKGWNKFIKEQEKHHNLVIKSSKNKWKSFKMSMSYLY